MERNKPFSTENIGLLADCPKKMNMITSNKKCTNLKVICL